ncbi:MAG: 3-hydroxyacyl-CoA dehydrogenase NAD-binding domain-containing protein [Halieaceae bacterium]|jgi:3-hydroxyacyl-CoA dehydrogenase|nr:3-hydroxyacyl-CoA dehydrogenase NAD-binding domain-containing protein [Halieaceae bacterium]
MDTAVVQYALDDEIGIVRIDNPPVNALSHAVRDGLMKALDQAAGDGSELLLIVCAGRTFIAGADISEFGQPPREPGLPAVIAAIENFPKPVLAALHGNALGGGLEVALAAHYRCALPGTRLGLPEVNLGLLPGAGGTQRLPRLVGVETALDMMTGGAPVSATRALQLGLIDRLLEDGDVTAAALGYARQLAADGAAVRPTGARPVVAPPGADFFDRYRAGIARKSRGLIAPGYIVELVEFACGHTIEEGQALERERFIQCRNSPQSAALRHVFFAERACAKLTNIPADTRALPVNTVAVIGAGTMGGGIAMCFANAGIPVTLVETSRENLERGLGVVRKNYETSIKRGRYSQQQVDSILANITGTTDYADIAATDLVIEAVFENMAVKQEVFRKLDGTCRADCILATNTSYLDVNEIAAATGRPGRVVGAHFFSPANVMKLLEVVRAEQTAPEVLLTFMQLAKAIGKIAVAVGVCHGFVGNRMLKGYARQAQLLLLEGASPEQVDGAMEAWGMAMGPLAVGDLAGLDIGYRSRRDQGMASRSTKEIALADTLVEMERLGQKSGAGYYRYDAETRSRQPDPGIASLIEEIAAQWGVTRRVISDEEIVDRLTLALINEGAAIVAEGVAARPGDVDVVYLNGYGFPKWRGGPMFHADSLGLATVVGKLEALQALTSDPCWQPAPLLVTLAQEGRTLASLNQ